MVQMDKIQISVDHKKKTIRTTKSICLYVMSLNADYKQVYT